jgi:hypothetical protein
MISGAAAPWKITTRGSGKGVTAMRYTAEKLIDGYWICDTQTGEFCFATRSHSQARAERWADTFNAAYMAFRDEAQLKFSRLRPSGVPAPSTIQRERQSPLVRE